MKKIVFIACALTCTVSLYAGHSKELKLMSPEGVHEVMFRQERISSSVNEMVYQVKYRGREVVGNSRAGLQLDNRTWELALARKINQANCWMDNLEVDSVIYQPAVDKTWHPCMESAARYMTLIMQLPCTFLKRMVLIIV